MKKELKVQELSTQEMRTIEGGSWIGRAWDWIKKHFTGNVEASYDQERGVYVGVGMTGIF